MTDSPFAKAVGLDESGNQTSTILNDYFAVCKHEKGKFLPLLHRACANDDVIAFEDFDGTPVQEACKRL